MVMSNLIPTNVEQINNWWLNHMYQYMKLTRKDTVLYQHEEHEYFYPNN